MASLLGVPECLKNLSHIPKYHMYGAGPSNIPERVTKALTLPIIAPLHPQAYQVMDEIREGLKYLFQTKNEATLALSCSGNGGMEAAICNLTEPGETVLIGANGMWGDRAATIASHYTENVISLNKKYGEVFSHDEVEAALAKHHPVLFFLVLGESSSGVLQPIEGIGDLCHKYNCLLVLDTVVCLGGIPIYTDQWEVDVNCAATQKCLFGPPGLAPITFSSRAINKILSRKTPVSSFYLNILKIGEVWGCFPGQSRGYHHTQPFQLYYALREALVMIAEEGLQNIWTRHKKCYTLLADGLKELGFQFFVKDEQYRLGIVTTICMKDINMQHLKKYLLEKHYFEIGDGLGPTREYVLRLGMLGFNAQPENVPLILGILKKGIDHERGLNVK